MSSICSVNYVMLQYNYNAIHIDFFYFIFVNDTLFTQDMVIQLHKLLLYNRFKDSLHT